MEKKQQEQTLLSYLDFLVGMGHFLGQNYEIVLYCYDETTHRGEVLHTIHPQFNNHHTGDEMNDLLLKKVDTLKENPSLPQISFYDKNARGEVFKCVALPVRFGKSELQGIVNLNFNLDRPLTSYLTNIVSLDNSASQELDEIEISDVFSKNIQDTITENVTEVSEEILKDNRISATNKNKEIILELKRRGIFKLKDGVVKVAEALNLSKNTVYLHLRNEKEES